MMPSTFEIDGVGYEVDANGVICQRDMTVRQVYDREYVASRYDRIPETVRQMSFLRAGFVYGVCGQPRSLLDIGYGNGDFLAVWRLWSSLYVDLWGYDVSDYPVPETCRRANAEDLYGRRWDVVTAFDSIEHIPDISFLGKLEAKRLVVTVPWCHGELGLGWFRRWKHRRPGEHLRHFNPASLVMTMKLYGFSFLTYSALEDAIRQPDNSHENTFTAVFTKSIG